MGVMRARIRLPARRWLSNAPVASSSTAAVAPPKTPHPSAPPQSKSGGGGAAIAGALALGVAGAFAYKEDPTLFGLLATAPPHLGGSTPAPAPAAPPAPPPSRGAAAPAAPPLNAEAAAERRAYALAQTLVSSSAAAEPPVAPPVREAPAAAAAPAPAPPTPAPPSPAPHAPPAPAPPAPAPPAPAPPAPAPPLPLPPPVPLPAPQDAALAALERARGEMRALLFRDVSEVIRGDFAEGARAQLEGLTAPQLREKALKLMEDAHDRARWEGVRLAEVLERSDRAWASKFEEYTAAARASLEQQAKDAVETAKRELQAVRGARSNPPPTPFSHCPSES